MPVFRDHAVFACQGDPYIEKKIPENAGITLEILDPLYISKFEIVLDPKNIEFFVQDLSWSLACPTGPRLTTHATGEARGALRFIGPIQPP